MFRSRRGHRERGATMVEFAVVTPLLLVLAFGTAEMGMAWVANNRVEASNSTAARIASSSGHLAEADLSVLQSLKSSLPQKQLNNLDRVIIFKATTANGSVPAACIKAVGSTDETGLNTATGTPCNTYAGATVRGTIPTSSLGFPQDDFWAPATRNDNLSDPPDYIGVWVRTKYTSTTGTFFKDITITKTSVYRIQPDLDG
jgi:Flp pilus assembly protein TadG